MDDKTSGWSQRTGNITLTGPAPENGQGSYPAVRPRRTRQHDWSRRLVAESSLSAADLIWPIFVADGENTRAPVDSMPGVERLSIDNAVRAAEEAARTGHTGRGALSVYGQHPAKRRCIRSPQSGQSGLPGNQGDQGCRSRGWHTLRRRTWIPTPATATTDCCRARKS